MKILYIINSLSVGGAEKMVIELSREMSKHANIHVLSLNSSNNEWYEKDLNNSEIKLIKWNCNFYNPLNAFKLINLLLEERYDVVHSHLTYAQFYGAIASYFVPHVCFVTTEHSSNNNRRNRKIFKYFDRWLYHRYRRVFSISMTAKSELIKWLDIREKDCKFSVFPNAVNINFFSKSKSVERANTGFSENDFILMMVGRLADAKDPTTIMRALVALPEKYKLILIGDGPCRHDFEQDAKKIGVEKRVFFIGTKKNISEWLKIADIYIQSSHWEGMPTALLEAMAAGILVIASNVAGNKDVLPNDMLFKHESSEDLVRLILSDKKGWVQIQQGIVQKYDMKFLAKELYNQYLHLL